MLILVPVSWGELLDKITILEIKAQRIRDDAKKFNVNKELAALNEIVFSQGQMKEGADKLIDDLRSVNAALWDIEDDIRDCERRADFTDQFIKLARAVYHTNDKRAALKRELNELLGSELIEEKSYQPY